MFCFFVIALILLITSFAFFSIWIYSHDTFYRTAAAGKAACCCILLKATVAGKVLVEA